MKTKIIAASLLTLSAVLTAALPAAAFAADVGVSISVGQPGFYGRLDVGGYPPPPLIYREPVLVERPVRYVESAPIYLRVPPGHARHWGQHCRAYNACGRRVYFVQDNWYAREYAPRYRAHQAEYHDHDHGRGPGGEHREERREEGRDHRGGHDQQHGEQHGRDHDRDRDHGRRD